MKDHPESSRAKRLAKQIAGYSLAAGAFLAAAPETEAGVVQSGPISEKFGGTFGLLALTIEGSAADFVFYGGGDTNYGGFLVAAKYGGVDVYSFGGPGTADQQQGIPFVNPQSASQAFGSGDFSTYGFFYIVESGRPYGAWNDSDPRYFGFTFERETDGAQLFGWGLVRALGFSDGEVLGWAYDDSGEPIHIGPIPEPSALGLFALGAAGLALYRRKRKRAKA